MSASEFDNAMPGYGQKKERNVCQIEREVERCMHDSMKMLSKFKSMYYSEDLASAARINGLIEKLEQTLQIDLDAVFRSFSTHPSWARSLKVESLVE